MKRTFRPLYGFTQATPKSGFLDPVWGRTVPIYPGMVMTKTVGNNYTLIGGADTSANPTTQQPAGLVGQFIGGYGIDELLDSGINALAVWVLAPDAEIELLAPAFAATQTWSDTGHGEDNLAYAAVSGSLQGQLVPAVYTVNKRSKTPVCRIIQIESPVALIVGGLTTRYGGTTN